MIRRKCILLKFGFLERDDKFQSHNFMHAHAALSTIKLKDLWLIDDLTKLNNKIIDIINYQ